MNRHDQDPHDWLTAQFSDDDDLDDENAGTDAADADAADSTAADTVTETEPRAAGPVTEPRAASPAPEPLVPAPVAPAPKPAAADSRPVPVESERTPAPAAPRYQPTVASEPIVTAPDPMRRASAPVSSTGTSFTWGLRPSGGPAAPVEQPASGAGATPPEREPDPIVPASFFPPTKAERPTAPTAARPVSAAAAAARPVSAAAAAARPVSAAAAAAPAAAPVSAATVSPATPPQPVRPFYPPPPAISRPAQRDAQPIAQPKAATQPPADVAQTDADAQPAMSISEVLDAPSSRRAAREAAARDEAAREAAARDDTIAAQELADEPQDDGIDDLVDPHAPSTPQASSPFVDPEVPGAGDPIRATGMARFDVPVVPTADGPALAGRPQSVANRAAGAKASSSRTQRVLLIVGIVLVVALGVVLIFVLGQRTDAAAVAGALDTVLSEAARLTRFL